MIAFNIMVYFLLGNAIGGPEAAARPGSWIYNPLVHVVGGVVGMFVFVTVVGESMNWLGKRIGEMAWRNEPERFKRQLDRAVHDFVEAAYSSKNAQRAVEARIIELYSEHPEQAMRYLSEVLGRTKSTGSPKTATRVEMMIEELKTEHSSSN